MGQLSRIPVYPFMVVALPVVYFHEANFRQLAVEDKSTALNTFSTLFNSLFNAGLPLREARYFFARMSAPSPIWR